MKCMDKLPVISRLSLNPGSLNVVSAGGRYTLAPARLPVLSPDSFSVPGGVKEQGSPV